MGLGHARHAYIALPLYARHAKSWSSILLTRSPHAMKWEQISFKTRPVPYWAFDSIGKFTCFLDVMNNGRLRSHLGRDEVKLHNMPEVIKCVPVFPVL